MDLQLTNEPDASRFSDPIDLVGSDFFDEIWVVCPKCGGCACDRSDGSLFARRLTCFACGHAKTIDCDSYLTGEAVDPFLNLPLWIAISTSKGELFAYNPSNLNLMKKYIGAKNRERKRGETGWRNRGYFSRLPAWIKAKENREMLLGKIEQLEARIAKGREGGQK